MSDLVDSTQIEAIVGVERHQTRHYARAVSAEQTAYVLHSRECLTSRVDLRECLFSLALDRGIEISRWTQDAAVHVHIERGRLVPVDATVQPSQREAR